MRCKVPRRQGRGWTAPPEAGLDLRMSGKRSTPLRVVDAFPFARFGFRPGLRPLPSPLSPAQPRRLRVAVAADPLLPTDPIVDWLTASSAVDVVGVHAPVGGQPSPDDGTRWSAASNGVVTIQNKGKEGAESISFVYNLLQPDGSPRRILEGPDYDWACWHHVCTQLEVDFVIDPQGHLNREWIRDQPRSILQSDQARAVVALHERVNFLPLTPARAAPATRTAAWQHAARAALPEVCALDARVPNANSTPWPHVQRPLMGVIERFEFLLAERDTLLACTLAGASGDDNMRQQRSWDALITQATAALDAMAGAVTKPGAPLADARDKGGYPPKFQADHFMKKVQEQYPAVAAEAEQIHQMSRALAKLRNQIHEGPLIHMADAKRQRPAEAALSEELVTSFEKNLCPHVPEIGLHRHTRSLDVWDYCEALVAIVRHILELVARWWESLDTQMASWKVADDSAWLDNFPVPRLVPADQRTPAHSHRVIQANAMGSRAEGGR